MKTKKIISLISGGLAICALVLLIVTIFVSRITCIISEIALAVLGSAGVAFTLSLSEYFVTKRPVLENLYYAIKEFIDILATQYYFNTTEKRNVLIFEQYRREYDREMGFEDYDETDVVLSREDRCNFEFELSKSIESYLTIAKLDTQKLRGAYSDVGFFFHNKSKVSNISSLIQHIVVALNSIDDETKDICQPSDGEKNRYNDYFCTVDRLNKIWYRMTENGSEMFVYRKIADSLYDELSKFGCCITGENYSRRTHSPIKVWVDTTGDLQ
jgi:hypothetical protein